MTANLPAERPAPKPQLTAGGQVAAIIPRTLEETFRLADAMSQSGMAPSTLKTPAQVMVAIIAGAELGMPPFQSMQSFAVINGRPSIWGDGLIAVVRSHGFRVREWMEGEGDDMIARCEVTRPDSGEVIPGEFSVADAKKAALWNKAGPWQTSPKRMLKMRARAFACRDGAADVLRGFQMREEVEDYQPVRDVTHRAQGSGLAARLAAPSTDAPAEGFNAVSGELLGGDNIPDFDATPDASGPPVSDGAVQPSQAGASETGDDFPGDRAPSGEGEGAEPAEVDATDDAGSASVSPSEVAADWHAAVVAAVPDMSADEITAFLANPDEQAAFARLEAHQPQLALDLNRAIGRRRKELAS